MEKIFIDGREGTTGLRLEKRLLGRSGLTILSLPEAERKNPHARAAMIHEADLVFFCLPDAAAAEGAKMAKGDTLLIDASTAHRTAEGWAYGFPELSPAHEDAIKSAGKVAVPGCHASGFIALVYPLVAAGALSTKEAMTCFSVTGYSGGGKKMITQYEAEGRDASLDSPRQYALSQTHKHLPEMTKVCGLQTPPIFCPIVADYPCGMAVTVPLFAKQISGGIKQIKEIYQNTYAGKPLIELCAPEPSGFLAANSLAGKDTMQIGVEGNEERILLTARFDNLGKGASGAAIQCMNLMLGFSQTEGLAI